jgi:hypothetical protein
MDPVFPAPLREPTTPRTGSTVACGKVQVLAEAFRIDFNTVRPHSSLKNLTPSEFVTSLAGSPAVPVRPQDQEPERTAGGVT